MAQPNPAKNHLHGIHHERHHDEPSGAQIPHDAEANTAKHKDPNCALGEVVGNGHSSSRRIDGQNTPEKVALVQERNRGHVHERERERRHVAENGHENRHGEVEFRRIGSACEVPRQGHSHEAKNGRERAPSEHPLECLAMRGDILEPLQASDRQSQQEIAQRGKVVGHEDGTEEMVHIHGEVHAHDRQV